MRKNYEWSARQPNESLETGMELRLERFVEDIDATIDLYSRVVG